MENEFNYIINMPDIGTTIDERGIGYVFYHKMKQYKNKIIQIDAITGEEETYDSFLRRCVRTAIVMKKKGVKEGDIIAICSENNMNTVVPYFASMFIGARSVSFPPYSSTQSNIYLVNQTKIMPKILFVTENVLDFAKALIKQQSCEIVVLDSSSEFTPFQEFLVPSPEEEYFRPYEAEDSKSIAIMQFNSGSTGSPKLVCASHYAYLGQLQMYLVCKCSYDRILMFTNLNWVTTTAYWGVTVLSGGLRIIVPKFDADNFFKLIDSYKPTFILMGRYLCLGIKPETKGNFDIGSIQTIGINGSALSREQFIWLKGLFPSAKVWSCYGSTEANLIAFPHTETEQEIEFFQNKLMSCGTMLVGRSYKVVDPETEEILGPNKIGELRMKTEYGPSCYYNMDSSELFDSHGWLKTGDLVYYDTDKYFYIADRLKDIIRIRDRIVYPLFIENILLSHPSVKEAVVVGKRDLIDGDQPMAVVVARENGVVTEEELVTFVNDKVDDYMKLSGGVLFVDSVPLTSSGKVSRFMTKMLAKDVDQRKR